MPSQTRKATETANLGESRESVSQNQAGAESRTPVVTQSSQGHETDMLVKKLEAIDSKLASRLGDLSTQMKKLESQITSKN